MDEIQRYILDDLYDDHFGLWEIKWSLDSSNFKIDERKIIDIISHLLNAGLIELRFGRMGLRNEPLNLADALVAVQDLSNWGVRKSPSEEVYSLGITPLGVTSLNM